ncbi:hypothetical protein WICPIJ_001765 [Wickerhamomyces pijperi]|uniref:Endonuclease/exonuclease/phosphatase domain-containing protein n=1 Tax=Wickerhamomyces pijperi TaxID=599730 RepID=A0A9P8QD44_WICPI|nr:hypothetical protein WICPIJ_001765 [Wickerhamomyces pijperi]
MSEIEESNSIPVPAPAAVPVPSKKSKKGKKGSRNPSEITPEYIAQQRALREAQKQAKREALIASGVDPDQIDLPLDLRFISRPLLDVPETIYSSSSSATSSSIAGVKVSIMTYNILAQALIRRKLFPTSGNALKWFKRSKVLLSEFKHYNSDILLLQEVDYIQYNSFWKPEFKKLGYLSDYQRWGDKNHGVAVFFRECMFDQTDRMTIDYDKEVIEGVPQRVQTKNVGLLVALKFKKAITDKYQESKKKGIIIGTTHLFWHPFGTVTRTRQTYIVLRQTMEFYKRVRLLQGKEDEWYTFFGGDFNSQPFDSPYLSITSKPIQYTDRARTVLECSTAYELEKVRLGSADADDEDAPEEEEGEDQEEEPEADSQTETTAAQQEIKFTTPVPESFEATQEEHDIIDRLQSVHNSQPIIAHSLYSLAYKHVHPENAGVDNTKDEPEISNWAHTWRGLLDYIFYVTPWDPSSSDDTKLSVKDVMDSYGFKITKLLKMPLGKDMPDHGIPHEGEYPSDHLCMIAEVELLL